MRVLRRFGLLGRHRLAGDRGAAHVARLCLVEAADAMHTLFVVRADKLEGCAEGSDEETELKMIADTVGAYEATRWPDGVAAGGKR